MGVVRPQPSDKPEELLCASCSALLSIEWVYGTQAYRESHVLHLLPSCFAWSVLFCAFFHLVPGSVVGFCLSASLHMGPLGSRECLASLSGSCHWSSGMLSEWDWSLMKICITLDLTLWLPHLLTITWHLLPLTFLYHLAVTYPCISCKYYSNVPRLNQSWACNDYGQRMFINAFIYATISALTHGL